MKDKKSNKYLITSIILIAVSFILIGIAAFIYFKVNSILKDTIVEVNETNNFLSLSLLFLFLILFLIFVSLRNY